MQRNANTCNLTSALICLLSFLILAACDDDAPVVIIEPPAPVEGEALTAVSQTVTTTLNTAIEITLQGTGSNVQFSVTSQPANGVLTGQVSGASPTMSYTPSPGFTGTDNFTFSVTDDASSSVTGVVDINVVDNILPGADTDDDGLTDLDELNNYGTNPNLADTDADGFSDFEEVITFAFDPDGNLLHFNPLIADTPKISIDLESAPEIQINYTETNGNTSSVSTARSQSSSSSFTRSDSSETTHSFEHAYEESVGFEGWKLKGEFKATQTVSDSTTTSWSEEQTSENSNALEAAEGFELSNEVSAGDGQIAIVASISNPGNLSYTVQNLVLGSTYFDLTQSKPTVPVGNLDFDSAQGGFPSVSLAPGQSTGALNFIAKNVNLQTIKRVLGNSRGLTVAPAIFDLLDENGDPYNFNLAGVQALAAAITVDFGISSGREPISEWVAVNGDPDAKLNVLDALQRILGLDVVVSATPGIITSVESIANAPVDAADPAGAKGVWVLVHAASSGANQSTQTVYTTPEQQARLLALNPQLIDLVSNYDPAQIVLRGGDFLTLTYVQDTDLDGLGDRQEFFYNTDALLADTDGDGLEDGTEVDGWDVAYAVGSTIFTSHIVSSALQADTDGDGLDDFAEANLAAADPNLSRNPLSPDTDKDGIPDVTDDFDTAQTPSVRLANVFDETDILNLSAVYNPAPPAPAPSVDISYELPDATGTGNFSIPGNNIAEYKVLILRFNNELGHPNIPEPTIEPIDNTLYSVGTRFPCDPAQLGTPTGGTASNTCDWVVADYFDPVAAGTIPPGPRTLNDADITIDSTNGSMALATGPFKYIAYVQVNGHYTRSSELAFAAGESEIIQIRMMGGRLVNYALRVPYDVAFDARFRLHVDDTPLQDGDFAGAPFTRPIAFSNANQSSIVTTYFDAGTPSGRREVFADTDSNLVNPAIAAGTDRYAGGGWNFIDNSVTITLGSGASQTGVPVYEFRVPASEGCHKIDVVVNELDTVFNQWQFVSFPSNASGFPVLDDWGVDTAMLCRDNAVAGAGNWTIESRLPNTDPKAAAEGIIGSAPSPTSGVTSTTGFSGATSTQTNSIFPIQYQTRPILWNHFTPNQHVSITPSGKWGDIRVRYDVFVVPPP